MLILCNGIFLFSNMSRKGHIVSVYHKNTQKAKNMDIITTLIPPIAGGIIVACIVIYSATAKRKIPMTPKEADILWKLHKKNTKCNSHKMKPRITKRGEITGFRCQCGYKYTQQRPLLSQALRKQTATNSTHKPSSGLSKLGARTQFPQSEP